jgi:Methyltransferase domain
MFLAGMLGNDGKTCVGIDDFSQAEAARDAFRARFDARRSSRHSFFDGDHREYFGSGGVPPIGVFLHDAGDSYEHQLEGLRTAEPFFADGSVIIVDDANRDVRRRAALDFRRDSRLAWRVVLDERTAGDHPTLWNGLMVLQAGGSGPDSRVELTTETRLVDPVAVQDHTPPHHPPRITVLHYRNPWVSVQDYPNLEIIGLNRGKRLTEAFEGSTGDYVVVLDPDVELTPDALSEAVREAEGGAPLARDANESGAALDGAEAASGVTRTWRSLSRAARRRKGVGSRGHSPLAQAEYFPSWSQTFDDGDEPQTVTVARALSVTRDNLVALDLDLHMDDMDREIAVRFARGLRLEGPAARCSRVPDGVVAGRVGAVLTPDGRWLIESAGAVTRAWPELALDDDGWVDLT